MTKKHYTKNNDIAFASDSTTNYQDLVVNTLKEKYQYFVMGLVVLAIALLGGTYLLMKNVKLNTFKQIAKKEVTSQEKKIATSPAVIAKNENVTEHPKAPTAPTAPTSVPTNTPAPTLTKAVPTPMVAKDTKTNQSIKSYTVQAGDNLWKIAEQFYKSGYVQQDLAKANNLVDPSTIEVGQTLILPSLPPKPFTVSDPSSTGIGGSEDQGQTSSAMTKPVQNPTNEYVVVAGDTLWSISEATLGDGFAWHQIADANKVTNPIDLEVGTKLRIPRGH